MIGVDGRVVIWRQATAELVAAITAKRGPVSPQTRALLMQAKQDLAGLTLLTEEIVVRVRALGDVLSRTAHSQLMTEHSIDATLVQPLRDLACRIDEAVTPKRPH